MDYDEEYSDEDFDDVELSKDSIYKASYVVVAIDTHPSMFKADDSGQVPFRNCLAACLRILDTLIMVKDSKRWNPFAVLLTRDDPKLVEFGDNIVESIQLLKSKLKLSDDELEDEFQRKLDFDLAEFFLQCKKAFHDIKAAFYKRILVYITNDDNPVKDAQSKFAAINEVKSFDASQITLEVISTDVKFDRTKLYNEMFALLEQSQQEREEICTDIDGLEQKLSSVLVPKYHRSKVQFYPFKDDLKRFLTCFDLKLVQSQKLYSTKVSAEGKSVKPKPPPLTADLPTYYIKNSNLSEQHIVFDEMEKDQLYDTSFPRGYTLVYIGKSVIDTMYHISKPHLLQAHFVEQTNFFKQFWQYCVKNERVLVCVVKYKQPGKIKFSQMSPILIGEVPTFLCKYIPIFF